MATMRAAAYRRVAAARRCECVYTAVPGHVQATARRGPCTTGASCAPPCGRRSLGSRIVRAGVTPQPKVPDVYVANNADDEMQRLQEHQKAAPRIAAPEQVRTLVQLARTAVVSGLGSTGDTAGYPSSAVLQFAADAAGRPVLSLSTLNPLQRDLAADGRCSFTVQAPGFKDLQDARAVLVGDVAAVPEDEAAAVRELFLAKYPDAFYVDFGDFRWLRLERVKSVRLTGGFGVQAAVSAEKYAAAAPDPVAQFSAPVCGHMNGDHGADTLAMVRHATGVAAEAATLLDLDSLGLNAAITLRGSTVRLRLPFPRPVLDRKGIKDAIVEMTRAARAAAASGA